MMRVKDTSHPTTHPIHTRTRHSRDALHLLWPLARKAHLHKHLIYYRDTSTHAHKHTHTNFLQSLSMLVSLLTLFCLHFYPCLVRTLCPYSFKSVEKPNNWRLLNCLLLRKWVLNAAKTVIPMIMWSILTYNQVSLASVFSQTSVCLSVKLHFIKWRIKKVHQRLWLPSLL